MQPPVFFLSTANQTQNPLPYLEKESERIYKLLTPAANQQLIQIHREPFATIDNTAHYLMQSKNRVSLFHYGGHANSQQLILRDQPANANGIAQLLAQQKSLKLVFLNGCSTRQQVQLLLKLGVSAIIATSAPINDECASAFAESFYTAIAAHHSIKEAFEIAAAVHQSKTGDRPQVFRGTELRFSNNMDELLWGLYASEEAPLEVVLIPAFKKEGHKKNVVVDSELDIGGDAHFGDNSSDGDEVYEKKNILEKSNIKVEGNFHLGDNIYQTSTPEERQISKQLKAIKTKLSVTKRIVLEESQTIDTPLELGILKFLEAMKEEEARIIVVLYQEIIEKPWREVTIIYNELEKHILTLKTHEEALAILNSNLMQKDSIDKKLRASIPLLPFIDFHANTLSGNHLSLLWQQCLNLSKKKV